MTRRKEEKEKKRKKENRCTNVRNNVRIKSCVIL